MISLFKKQRPATVLGLTLDGGRMEAAVVRRQNGSVQLLQSVAAPLTLSLLGGDPELVGQEIRNQLAQAGIRERRCVVCLPLSWVLALQTKLPDLPEADLESLLQLEAERGFHSGTENLLINTSRFSAAGDRLATMLAIPRGHLAGLEAVLKAAQLKPLGFMIGVTALEGVTSAQGALTLTLSLDAAALDLQITAAGGIIALRSLNNAIETDGAQKKVDAELVARELRITLGQLPAGVSGFTRTVKIYGRGDIARQFVADFKPRAEAMGLKVQVMERASALQFTKALPPEIALSPALALAANYVRGLNSGSDFLPPKISAWKQMMASRFGSKKLAWAGAAAGVLILAAGAAFGYQEVQLRSLQSRWDAMSGQVALVDNANAMRQKYRAWYDPTCKALRLWKTLTHAFPEVGTVTAKTLEIRDLSTVSCSGVAQDRQSVLRVIDLLGKSDGVSELNPESIRGQSPAVQFTFTFQYGGGTNGN